MKRLILGALALAAFSFTLSANTLISVTSSSTGASGNYSNNGNPGNNFYAVQFTVSSDFHNGAATAQLEGSFGHPMSFSTYLFEDTTEVATGSVSDPSAPFPVISYNLFSNPFALNAGHTYTLYIAGSSNTVWDTGNGGTVTTTDPSITAGPSSFSASTEGGALSGISSPLLFTLTADAGAATPEPGTFALFGLAAATVLGLRRRK